MVFIVVVVNGFEQGEKKFLHFWLVMYDATKPMTRRFK